ncbi:MAG: lytic murein transglycosylase [Sphingomicrobium sp.]
MVGWLVTVWLSASVTSATQQTTPAAAPVQAVLRPAYTQQLPQAVPQTSAYNFETYKRWLISRAIRDGVRPATAQTYVPTLQFNQRAVDLDRSPINISDPNRPAPPITPYLQEHVTPSMISRGQAHYYDHYANLQRVEARFGVDPSVMMAIYGHETSYGKVTGGFDLLDVLGSLAYDGRRRELFESELIAALKLIDLGVPRWRLKGSYAGATGYPQFMPSVVLRLRVDGDADGYADVWSNEVDGLASIGNYLREAGWKPGVPWGVRVRTPANLNRYAIRSTVHAPRCQRVYQRHSRWLQMREWRVLGVVPVGRTLADNEMATLIEPDGPGGSAYLLTNNYRTILDYNCSNYYALSVGLLADAIARR